MMQWLLDIGRGYRWEVSDRYVLCAVRKIAPEQLPSLVEVVQEFVDRVPRVVWSLYGPDGSGRVAP